MTLTDQQADQIAHLLNTRNQLVKTYDRLQIISYQNNYLARFDDNANVIAFIEMKKVQWYQTELCHLTVAESHARRGHGKLLLQEAEASCKADGVRVLQCTIREDNVASRNLFVGAGFHFVSKFFYNRSGNKVDVFQKVISLPPGG